APVITSSTSATGTVGSAFSYQIVASNSPTSFNATGLPSGLSINTTSGLISGTPVAAGTATVVLSATNSGGTGTANLALTINNLLPTLTSINPSTATAGGASFTLTATGTNFVNGSQVRWNGSARTTTFVNGTTLTALILASDIASSGSA